MTTVTTTSLLALLCAIFGRFEKRIDWLKLAFVVVTVIACLHYNYGNDYESYYQCWEIISKHSLESLLTAGQFYFGGNKPETGWILINKIFGFRYGFYYMVAFLNIAVNAIYYQFIRKYVHEKQYFWAFFLYLFTYKFYLLNFSMMRQGFAISLVLLSFMHFCDRDDIGTLMILATAISMHISAVVMIPTLLLCRFEEKTSLKTFVMIALSTGILLFLATGFSGNLFNFVVSLSLFSKYKAYYAGKLAEYSLGPGTILLTIPHFVMCYFVFKARHLSRESKYLIIFSYMSFLIRPFEISGAALISRVGFYFSAFDIAIVPTIYSKVKNPLIRIMLYASLILITVYTYIAFFYNPTYKRSYWEFHSIAELFG